MAVKFSSTAVNRICGRFWRDSASADPGATLLLESDDAEVIAQALAERGLGYERWPVKPELPAAADSAAVLAAYAAEIAQVQASGTHPTVDAIRLGPDHPDRATLRQKFLSEHTHSEDEVRFFVEGRGLFVIHLAGEVLQVLCETGDFLRVPAGIRKGKRTERIYELSADTCRLVDTAATHGGDTLFLWPMDQSGLYNHFKKITGRAGLGTGRDVMFHAIRRTTASHLAAAGGDATAYLGHSSDRITRRSYLDPRIVQAAGRKPIDALPKIRRPAS